MYFRERVQVYPGANSSSFTLPDPVCLVGAQLGGGGKTGGYLRQRTVPFSRAWRRARVHHVVQGVPGKSLDILQALAVGGRIAAKAHVVECQDHRHHANQLAHRQGSEDCLLVAEIKRKRARDSDVKNSLFLCCLPNSAAVAHIFLAFPPLANRILAGGKFTTRGGVDIAGETPCQYCAAIPAI